MERLALLLAWLIAVGAFVGATAEAQVAPVGATAEIKDSRGEVLANATLREAADQVFISLAFSDRTALTGTHAIQIHAIGRCDPPDFATAGRIFNPTGKQHGLRNPNGPMAGDLPNLVIGPAGVSVYNLAAAHVTLGSGPGSLLGGQGTSLVIFAQPDDDTSQPEGNAGARVACGVIAGGSTPVNSWPDLNHAVAIGGMGALMIVAGVVLRRPQL